MIGSDRLHATWTRFDLDGSGYIYHSFSDDQARSWSPAKPISRSAGFCRGFVDPATSECDDNQFSVPTVHPKTGLLGVAFENFNTVDENQYLFVRSRDGGVTFEGPFHVTPVFDVNYPRGASRPDCRARGQAASRAVLTNSCFRVNSGGAVVIDKRGGAFADDFYLVMSDNRNGTPASSNTDVFFFRSTDGGSTWVGPTRVNNDRSVPPADRDEPTQGNFGNDQWFPWIDVDEDGTLAVAFYDRRLDEDSVAPRVAHEPPAAGQLPDVAVRRRLSGREHALAGLPRAGRHDDRAADGSAEPSRRVRFPARARASSGRSRTRSSRTCRPTWTTRSGPACSWATTTRSRIRTSRDLSKGESANDDNGHGDKALAVWTDARNGRGSGAPTSFQAGRNPACEQSDMFIDYFDPLRRDLSDAVSESEEDAFLVTPCPGDDGGHGGGGGDDDDDD